MCIRDRANMMSYVLSTVVLTIFMFVLDYRIGLIAVFVILVATLIANGMNKMSLSEAVIRQEQGEKLTDSVLSFAEGISVIKSYNLLGDKDVYKRQQSLHQLLVLILEHIFTTNSLATGRKKVFCKGEKNYIEGYQLLDKINPLTICLLYTSRCV